MASGSQTYSGSWADLPVTANSMNSVIASRAPEATVPTLANTVAKSSEPNAQNMTNIAISKPKSPTRLTMKALRPARALPSPCSPFSYQKPINR